LLEKLRANRPAALLATTNDLESPLSQVGAGIDAPTVLLPIDAAPETTVSTRTYVNTVALSQLAAIAMCGHDLAPVCTSLEATAEAMADFLEGWEEHLQVVGERLASPRHLVFLGRGSSMATAYCGALICGEAARFPAIAMPAGEFRHGPLETSAPDLTVILFAGPPETTHLNQRLARDLVRCGARVNWVGPELDGVSTLPVPAVSGVGLPLTELLPVQLASLHLAQQAGVVPGEFRRIGKVTLEE
jgi:glucosamine--fructose-6-phosphate aminotransferase (isomerizing)